MNDLAKVHRLNVPVNLSKSTVSVYMCVYWEFRQPPFRDTQQSETLQAVTHLSVAMDHTGHLSLMKF